MSDEAKSVLDADVHLVLKAARYAARKHKGQTRLDGSTPYVSHAFSVAFVLRHVFGVEDEAIVAAALLHDVLEDTRTKYDELVEVFGPRIAAYVVALTKNPLLPKKERDIEYEERLMTAPEPVKIAKLADMFDNMMFRMESPRLARTVATARRVATAFVPRMQTETGKAAVAKILKLIEEIEREAGLRRAE